MSDEFVNYQGRKVSKDGFRVFVFKEHDATKLVNSYEEYEEALVNGWVSTKDELPQVEPKKMVQVDLAQVTDLAKGKKFTKRG